MNFIEEENMIPSELPDELASIRHINTYKTPSGYFENLADEIMSQVSLSSVSENPYSAPPPNYFDTLAGSILAKINANNRAFSKSDVQKETEEIEPLFAEITNKNVYSVPTDYFNSFSVEISNTKQAPVKKITSLPRWINYVAAAVVTGIIATGIIIFTEENNGHVFSNNTNYEKALSKVSDNEISNYLDKNVVADVDFASLPLEGNNTGINNPEGLLKTLLNNVSDNQIQQYLNENGDGNEKDIKGI